MKARLLAFMLVVAIAGLVQTAAPTRRSPAPFDAGRLMPPQLGDFHVVRDWHGLPLEGGAEIGAEYADDSGALAQIDVHLGATREHNGIACFLARGAVLGWYGLHRLPLADDPAGAEFELALVRDESVEPARTMLIASTECRSDGCAQNLPLHANTGGGWPQLLRREPDEVATPVLLLVPQTGDAVDPEALLQRLRRFAGKIRLEPLRALAASQGSASAPIPDAMTPRLAKAPSRARSDPHGLHAIDRSDSAGLPPAGGFETPTRRSGRPVS